MLHHTHHMVDILSVEVQVVAIEEDTLALAEGTHLGSHSRKGEEGRGGSHLHHLLATPVQVSSIKEEEGLLQGEEEESICGSVDEEGDHKHSLVTIQIVIQVIPTLVVLNHSTRILTALLQWEEVMGSMVVPQDLDKQRLPPDTVKEGGGVINQLSHGHLPQDPPTATTHQFLHYS